jgi:CRISPR-associated endonuclease Cas1 subtype II
MSWRIVVVAHRAKLDYKVGCMEVRTDKITKIHLSEISTLVIESTAVSITTSLISELVKKKIKIIFGDEKRNPICEAQSYYGSHDTSAKVREQVTWNDDVKGHVWTEIITEKIRNQARVLKHFNKPEFMQLEEYINEVEFRDETNREGHAAKVYFNAMFGMGFSRSQDIPINAALNYGYTIILSAVNREIVKNGYITQLGLFHDNMFNQFNLGSDLMEPFRTLIDVKVMGMNFIELEHKEKMDLISVLNDEVIIDGKRQYVNNAIAIYCRSVFDAINENDVSLIKFYKNEL